jgi:Peptidase family M28
LFDGEIPMPASGWKALLDGAPWLTAEGAYPLAAYSEFMPAPRLGRKAYRHARPEPLPFADDDPWGWHVSEYEEALELQPGMNQVGRQLVEALVRLAHGRPGHGIAPKKLIGNPYWPERLAAKAGHLNHERFVFLSPLALARTQDDKGRHRWTLFGGSEQGPERAFWKSFHTAPNRETPENIGIDFIRSLLAEVYGLQVRDADHLRDAGFRILPSDKRDPFPPSPDESLPTWTSRYLWRPRQNAEGVKYLLTFRPFDRLPEAFQAAYLRGRLHLLPYPGSLIFWGAPGPLKMLSDLPLAMQTPLQSVIARHEGPYGLRVPQAGWLHEPRPGRETPHPDHGPMRNTFRRTHRWAKVLRDQDELALMGREDKVLHVLFSTIPDDLGLYDKPMARNAHLWTHDFRLLLNGPRASGADLKAALHAVEEGGTFGYRFVYPAMRVGRHEVYWHRPLVAWLSKGGEPAVLRDGPLGYFTAYDEDPPQLDKAVELWPRLLRRDLPLAVVGMMAPHQPPQAHHAARGLRKLFDAWVVCGEKPLSRSFARSLLAVPKHQTLDSWLEALPGEAGAGEAGAQTAEGVKAILEPEETELPRRRGARTPDSVTFGRTATRSFETTYWKTIAYLAEGKYRNKNNADCVRDDATRRMLSHERRDLEALGDYLLGHYAKAIDKAGLTGKALAGELPFQWRTDFDFPWADGWLANQDGRTHERDLIAVIPGRDRRRAVILADHYDTAYMVDCFDPEYGGDGARVAAAGADDNHSATACMMLAAPILLDLSRQGLLGCDVWLVHLTGEEFPSDCLGARALTERLIEGTLRLRLPNGRERDLSRVEIQGVYVMDMIAHNNDRDRDVFQMSPGVGAPSLWLAQQSQTATEIWNSSAPIWNQKPTRKGKGRGRRSLTSGDVPEVAAHPTLMGQVRTPADPRSTLYNTDGQIFSDAGVPVVLFMENYDINRQGYHDTHDTMANIDLDYGAAVAAIAIESAARAATEKPGR